MAEELDPKVAAAYRALGAEQPPRALDETILAAARRPARSWTQRWAVPVSLAAVVVLSVVVTLRVQHEQPAPEQPEKSSVPAPAPAAAAKPADKSPQRRIPQAPRAAQPEPAAVAEDKTGAPPAAAGELASRADENRREMSSAAGAAAPRAMARAAPTPARDRAVELPPAQELERIAALRAQGRHDEADKALAAFRKRYPDYRIPPATLDRVERR